MAFRAVSRYLEQQARQAAAVFCNMPWWCINLLHTYLTLAALGSCPAIETLWAATVVQAWTGSFSLMLLLGVTTVRKSYHPLRVHVLTRQTELLEAARPDWISLVDQLRDYYVPGP